MREAKPRGFQLEGLEETGSDPERWRDVQTYSLASGQEGTAA